ncbi:MAG: XRE family transcriptional regulator [Beijerinckiaceae bacterium]|nr:MAG: XRE family transcriptional regulator [Beijerinckiaceae bacterium]
MDHITQSSGNIFADLGFDAPEEELNKAKFVASLRRIIKERKLTQKAAATVMNISQPDVSKLLRGQVSGFSLERLFDFIRLLGNDVEIKIRKTNSDQPGTVRLMEVA